MLSKKCANPEALAATKHFHVHARGDFTDPEDGKRKKVSKFTGKYTPAEAAAYAKSALYQAATKWNAVRCRLSRRS